jgi:hypothetical protein
MFGVQSSSYCNAHQGPCEVVKQKETVHILHFDLNKYPESQLKKQQLFNPLKDEAQTALFKDPVRTAL